MECYISLCDDDIRVLLPLTEGHVFDFLGCLNTERLSCRRRVAAKSVLQYLSAILIMQNLYILSLTLHFTFVYVAHRANRKWEKNLFPAPLVLNGTPADVLQNIWHLGMRTKSMGTLLDVALLFPLTSLTNCARAPLSHSNCKTFGNRDDRSMTYELPGSAGKPAANNSSSSLRRMTVCHRSIFCEVSSAPWYAHMILCTP